jgi:hypothetical protein
VRNDVNTERQRTERDSGGEERRGREREGKRGVEESTWEKWYRVLSFCVILLQI